MHMLLIQMRLFQAMVMAAFCLQLVLNFIPITAIGYDPVAQRIMSFDGYEVFISINADFAQMLSLLLLFSFGVSSFCMLFFQNWLRYLYLVLWACGWLSTLLFWIRIAHPLQGFLGMALGTLDGGIVALAFVSSLRQVFQSKFWL